MRAKFICQTKTEYIGNTQVYKLVAATGSGNEEWSKYTPSGTLDITITNPKVFNFLVVGKEYYIDFSSVERDI